MVQSGAQGPGGPQRSLIFFDASVLVAAAHSPSGGSALTLEVCRGTEFRAAISVRVLLEARVNISEKFGEEDLLRFYRLLAALDPEVVHPPEADQVARCIPLVGDKDAHVLGAALDCAATYLLTLDRRHLLTPSIRSARLPLQVLTPGDFLQQVVRQER